MKPAHRLPIAVGAVVLLIGWWAWSRRAEAQAEALFSRVQAAVERGRAGALIDQLDAGYDVAAHWPGVFDGDGAAGGDPIQAREQARRGLAALFFMQRERPFRMTWRIESLSEGVDGWEARVSIDLTTVDGEMPFRLGGIANHRFVVRRDGWLWPAMRIAGHDRIELRR